MLVTDSDRHLTPGPAGGPWPIILSAGWAKPLSQPGSVTVLGPRSSAPSLPRNRPGPAPPPAHGIMSSSLVCPRRSGSKSDGRRRHRMAARPRAGVTPVSLGGGNWLVTRVMEVVSGYDSESRVTGTPGGQRQVAHPTKNYVSCRPARAPRPRARASEARTRRVCRNSWAMLFTGNGPLT